MAQKKIIFLLFTFVLMVISALFVVDTQKGERCKEMAPNDWYCVRNVDNITQPILLAIVPIMFFAFIFLFVRREAFIAWARFAGVAFPIMLGTLLYTFTHESTGAAWMSGPSNAQISATILPALFVIVSFVIIAFNQAKK